MYRFRRERWPHQLYKCETAMDWEYMGGTIDDAAGECFDKVAVMLGLHFPRRARASKLAKMGDPKSIAFPRPLLDDKTRLEFSFSGLKTAVRYHIAGTGKQIGMKLNCLSNRKPTLLHRLSKRWLIVWWANVCRRFGKVVLVACVLVEEWQRNGLSIAVTTRV